MCAHILNVVEHTHKFHELLNNSIYTNHIINNKEIINCLANKFPIR